MSDEITLQFDDALLGELFAVLDSAEAYIRQRSKGPAAHRIIDDIVNLRGRLIAHRPATGVYTAALLSALMDNAVDSIVVTGGDGIVKSFNPSAERAFGYVAAEIIGKNVSILMPSPYREEHDGYIRRYLRTGERKVAGIGRDVTCRRKDGSTFRAHLALTHVRVGGTDVFAGFLRDTGRPDGVPSSPP